MLNTWATLVEEYQNLLACRALAKVSISNVTASLRSNTHTSLQQKKNSSKLVVTKVRAILRIKTIASDRQRRYIRSRKNLRPSRSSLLSGVNLYQLSHKVWGYGRLQSRKSWWRLVRKVKWKSRRLVRFSRRVKSISKSRRLMLRSLLSSGHNSLNLSTGGSPSLRKAGASLHLDKIRRSYQSRAGSSLFNQHKTIAINQSVDHLLTNSSILLTSMLSPFLLKTTLFRYNNQANWRTMRSLLIKNLPIETASILFRTNLIPSTAFDKTFSKSVINSLANQRFREDVIPFYQNTLIRFIEFCTGRRAIFQFYPFVNQHVEKDFMVRYHRWIPRLNFYERRLGHRFFLEEALHILHLGFSLRDPKIIASWLRAIILRISFWKTRSIFRFLKYLFNNYFIHVFDDLKIKGMKIRLKGKISAAGNSRKRTILYRIGKTSHAEVNLRVLKDFSLINTFTGVMGFQVYLFY
jgi:hypothetical protein